MDEIHANERGLRLPSTPVEMAFNYPNGLIAYLITIFHVFLELSCSDVNCQVAAMEIT